MTCKPADKTDTTDETSNAGPVLNEWGIPDWRDPAAYGDTKKWTLDRWRWEFYRRRADVRSHYKMGGGDFFQDKLLYSGEAFLKFRYYRLPDPRIGAHPLDHIRSLPELLMPCMARNDAGPDGSSGTVEERLKAAGVKLTLEQKRALFWTLGKIPVDFGLSNDAVSIVFDLNKPLDIQIKEAKLFLKVQYGKRNLKPQRKRHPAKWLSYLRVLDAHEAHATWREIADVFFRQRVLARYKNPAGGYMNPPPQAARALWLAAKGLQSNF